MRRAGAESGQTSTEYMLLVSVVVTAIVAVAFVFVPTFQDGVLSLAGDVRSILDNGTIGGIGLARNDAGVAFRPATFTPGVGLNTVQPNVIVEPPTGPDLKPLDLPPAGNATTP